MHVIMCVCVSSKRARGVFEIVARVHNTYIHIYRKIGLVWREILDIIINLIRKYYILHQFHVSFVHVTAMYVLYTIRNIEINI